MRRCVLLAIALLLAGCAEEGAPPPATATPTPSPTPAPTPTPPPPPPPTPSPAPPTGVSIVGFKFLPATLHVDVGATVTWGNGDRATHTATAEDGSWDTGNIASEDTATHTFDADGTFPYKCKIHSSMRGTIVVGTGENAATPAPPPPPTPTPAPATPTPTLAAPPPVTIEIEGFAFVGGARTVPVGSTVTWTNRDASPHTATADSGAFDTGLLDMGASASHTFSAAGTFPYHCAFHPSMTSTLTVTA